jgi:hypothetical protein
MNFQTINLKLFLILITTFFYLNIIVAQEESNEDVSFKSYAVGLSLGWYNPSLDYWKDNSEFKDASFSGAISVKGFYDLQITKNLHGQVGIGYWQSSTEHDLQGFGNTKLLLTGVPISLDIQYYIEAIRFSIITPYVGAGGEYTFIQHKLNFEQKDNPVPSNGSTFLGNVVVGLEAKLSNNFAMDLEFRYKFGSYNQEFKREIIDPENPDDPTFEIVEEKINLNGPFVGLSLKYLF